MSKKSIESATLGTRASTPDLMITEKEKYRLIADDLGSFRMMVRVSDGAVLSWMEHDMSGRVMRAKNVSEPFGFVGGLYNQRTGLVRFGARDYDPEIGRWLSKDPILFNGGDTNLYEYVANDPVNFVDPTGLYWFRQPWQTPGEVGRVGSIVPPAPAGYTFGQNHDGFVDWATSRGVPDWLANIPSMIPLYGYSVGQEALRSAGIINQPTPSNGQMCK